MKIVKTALTTLLKLMKSRTFWTVIVLFVVNGIEGIREYIPANSLPLIDGILGILTIYFAKVNPKVKL